MLEDVLMGEDIEKFDKLYNEEMKKEGDGNE